MMTEMVMSKTTSQKRINPRTGKPYYYKDNPEAVKARNARRMWVNGKEVSKFHPLHKPGRYKTLGDAAFSSLKGYETIKEGEVYIIHNPSFPGWIKVGMALSANDRLKQFQTSSPFRDYELIKAYKVEDRRLSEAEAHKTLGNKNRKGEWFHMDHNAAIAILDKIFTEVYQHELF